MLRPRRSTLFIAVALLAIAPPCLGAHIRAKILRVGFPGSGGDVNTPKGMDLYRPGYWTPILVELNNDDGDLFEGLLKARQVDRDGDQVVSTLPIAVRGTRNVFIYVPAGPPQSEQPFALRVTTTEGAPVPMFDDNNAPISEWLPSTDARPLEASAHLLLDISIPPLNEVNGLVQDGRLVRPLTVARIAPSSLPDSLPGLQMVDYILWDNADPGQFRDISQQQALVDWVHRGGTLVIGVARNWELINKSLLADLLPAKLTGTTSASNLPALAEAVLGLPAEFVPALTYCPIMSGDLTTDAVSIVPDVEQLKDAKTPVFIASRTCGRGRIVLVATELSELLQRGTEGPRQVLLRQIFGLRKDSSPEKENNGMLASFDLFRNVELATAFRVTGGLYFLVAFLFVVLYIVIATAGTWSVLHRRGRVQHSWVAFALVAGVASGTSLAAVQIIRGIGHNVQQLSIVDSQAGSTRAVASCYFGLKTASHVSLDLSVPRDPQHAAETADNAGGLMPLAFSGDAGSLSQYAAGARYEAGGPVGQLWNVPIRATLKQFQGGWSGRLAGQVDASLARPLGGKIAYESWIENRLDTDLVDCYLIFTGTNVGGDMVAEGARVTSRASRMTVYPIERLPRGKRLVWKEYLIAQLREEQKRRRAQTGVEMVIDEEAPIYVPPPFGDRQAAWLKKLNVAPLDPYGNRTSDITVDSDTLHAALLALTTFSELSKDSLGLSGGEILRSRGLELDRSDSITTQTALLVGFADGSSGPTRLAWRAAGGTSADWKTIEPSNAQTMYRFIIPVATK